MDELKEKLMPCPFCGSDRVTIEDNSSEDEEDYIILCEGCGCAVLASNDAMPVAKEELIQKWNERATTQAARLLTLDEAVRTDVCFVEYRGAGISPAFVSLVKNSWLNEPMYRIQYANSHFYPDIAKCGKHYRIWSTLPTKEQAEAEPWK